MTLTEWQITSVLSSLTRITGLLLSGAFYGFGLLYLASPYLQIDVSSASLTASFGALPAVVKAGVKFVVALPFVFHTVNGVRHLVFDTGRGMGMVMVKRSGWAVVAVTVLGAAGLGIGM